MVIAQCPLSEKVRADMAGNVRFGPKAACMQIPALADVTIVAKIHAVVADTVPRGMGAWSAD